jgi:glycosyltransferase involved in cell wall biosynthesis
MAEGKRGRKEDRMTSADHAEGAGSSRRPRVVHVINSLATGGAETMLTRVVVAADSSRFEHLVLPLREGGFLAERVREAGSLTRPLEVDGARHLITAPFRLAARLRHLRADLVQGWLLQGNLAASLGTILGRPDTPVLWNVRWTLYDPASERLVTRALLRFSGILARHPSHIIFNSHVAVSQHAAIGFPAEKARVIPNGFDVDRFRPDPVARVAIRHELRIPLDAEVVGMVARYDPMKDHEMSLRAAAHIARRRPDAFFVYAGPDVDTHNERLSRLVQGFGLTERVRLLGERQDVARLYASFDVYWMSSVASGIAEGFPNVIAEAMASGVPCVATDVGDARSIIGQAGRIVQSRDWRAFGDATADLLEGGAHTLEPLGREARTRIARDFSLGAVVDAYHALYAEVLDESRERRARR